MIAERKFSAERRLAAVVAEHHTETAVAKFSRFQHRSICTPEGSFGYVRSEKVFVSQERVSGFPEKGADLGSFPNFPGSLGELPGNLWIAVKFHSERTSGEVTEKLRGSPGTSQKLGGA